MWDSNDIIILQTFQRNVWEISLFYLAEARERSGWLLPTQLYVKNVQLVAGNMNVPSHHIIIWECNKILVPIWRCHSPWHWLYVGTKAGRNDLSNKKQPFLCETFGKLLLRDAAMRTAVTKSIHVRNCMQLIMTASIKCRHTEHPSVGTYRYLCHVHPTTYPLRRPTSCAMELSSHKVTSYCRYADTLFILLHPYNSFLVCECELRVVQVCAMNLKNYEHASNL